MRKWSMYLIAAVALIFIGFYIRAWYDYEPPREIEICASPLNNENYDFRWSWISFDLNGIDKVYLPYPIPENYADSYYECRDTIGVYPDAQYISIKCYFKVKGKNAQEIASKLHLHCCAQRKGNSLYISTVGEKNDDEVTAVVTYVPYVPQNVAIAYRKDLGRFQGWGGKDTEGCNEVYEPTVAELYPSEWTPCVGSFSCPESRENVTVPKTME